MPKLPQISGQELVKRLVANGFIFISQKGSHIKLRRGATTIIVPNHKEIKRGTLHHIIKLAKIDL